jgi:hypothetical protein
MQTYFECYPCFLRQALEAAQMADANQDQKYAIIQEARELMKHLQNDATPPAIGAKVHQIVREVTGKNDPYQQAKNASTAQALAILPTLYDHLKSSQDKLETALRLSIAGNIIDFGPNKTYDLEEIVSRFLTQEFAINDLDLLRQQLKTADSVLLLGDNAGETVFDRLLVENLPLPVTYAVRGGPVINDATHEDAIAVGMDRVAKVIENGTHIPGTILNECSPTFQAVFKAADLILAKGMGNYETLSTTPGPIFFLLQVKCPVIGWDIGAPEGSMIIKQSDVY